MRGKNVLKRHSKNRAACLALMLAAAFAVCGCAVSEDSPWAKNQNGAAETMNEDTGGQAAEQETGERGQTAEGYINESGNYEQSGNAPIHDNKSLYELDDDSRVATMYLTVQSGNASDNTNHTWTEINQNSAYYYDELGIERYKVEGILKVGNENGPVIGDFGYDDFTPNVTVTIRGQTSTRSAQKNYRIKIKDGKGSYKDQTVINLNKHVSEGLRFRNKLCYDLMEELPGMMSARTQFVHLYVKDNTAGGSGEYQDYGIYTQVEQINKRYLRNHGLDNNGQLYKINFFEFYRYEDVIVPASSSGYDLEAFESYMEVKGSDDHTKLIRMLDELNDDTIPIEQTFAKWFDEENVFSWLAFHILVGNKDTQSRNCFLYSPLNVDKWYFISWDNDASFMDTERQILDWHDGLDWESGISNYWGNVLFRRVLKSDEYRQKLDSKINEFKAIMTPEKINSLIESYDSVLMPYLQRVPDVYYMRLSFEDRELVKSSIAGEIEGNYQKYLQTLQNPQPFFIGMPELTAEGLQISWDVAYDFQNDDVSYTVELADDYSFENPIYRNEGLFLPETVVTEELPSGQYFVRVKAVDGEGNSSYAFDSYMSGNGKIYGTKCFYILIDGTIAEDIYVE